MEWESFLSQQQSKGRLFLRRDVWLSSYTTFRIGGRAKEAVAFQSIAALKEAVAILQQEKIPYVVLGNGSNLLFDDRGYGGAVLLTSPLRRWQRTGTLLRAACGTPLPFLAREAQKAGLSGLEFAAGIPATVGGAVYMNAGAFGHAIGDVLVESVCYDTQTQKTYRLSKEAHAFSYRKSRYQRKDLLLLCATFALQKDDKQCIADRMAQYQRYRNETQPHLPSAGSTFRRAQGISAGKWLEDAGMKGARIGDAQVSDLHAGFLVNAGHATAKDVLSLIAECQKKVQEKYQVKLQCELEFVSDPTQTG